MNTWQLKANNLFRMLTVSFIIVAGVLAAISSCTATSSFANTVFAVLACIYLMLAFFSGVLLLTSK